MKVNAIEILSCKFGKTISMAYYNKVDGLNYDVEDGDDPPHPDLKKALVALHPDLAAAHYVIGEERENFLPNGFSITKAGDDDKIDQVNITGKLVTAHDKKITISSGDIPMNSKGLEDKIENFRVDLWGFFFNDKNGLPAKEQELPGMPPRGEEEPTPEEPPVVPDIGDGE